VSDRRRPAWGTLGDVAKNTAKALALVALALLALLMLTKAEAASPAKHRHDKLEARIQLQLTPKAGGQA
jgi:hypothetical protein